MSDKIFKNYWKKKLADAPSGLPENDNNVPYKHLMEYNGKTVFYSTRSLNGTAILHGTGTLKINNSILDIISDTNRCTILKSSIKTIAWDENEQSYYINDDFEFSIIN